MEALTVLGEEGAMQLQFHLMTGKQMKGGLTLWSCSWDRGSFLCRSSWRQGVHPAWLSCINSPRLVSSQAGNFFPKFERFFAFTHLSLLSSVLTVFHLQRSMCLLRPFILPTSEELDTECNFAKERFPRESLKNHLCF